MKVYVIKDERGWYFCELKAKEYVICLETTTERDYATKFTNKKCCTKVYSLLKFLYKNHITEFKFNPEIVKVEGEKNETKQNS